MTAVILAAGVSSRLRPLTTDTPKSLLEVGDKPLLQRNLETLKQHEITRCVIITGYLQEMIESFVNSLRLGIEIEFIYNPVYEQTNNNYSLWLARPAVDGQEIVLLDADILFDRRILSRLLASSHKDALIMRASDHLGHEEIKCELDDEGAVVKIGKHLDPKKSAGESLGIEKFSAATTSKLFDVLSRRHVHDEFYEASFQEVIDNGARIFAVESDGLPCMEIDTPDDLAAAEELAKKLQ
ncbi:MAG: phosphocholine cytidylyltransferase family protein [Bacteroidota bacterium]